MKDISKKLFKLIHSKLKQIRLRITRSKVMPDVPKNREEVLAAVQSLLAKTDREKDCV